MDDLNKVRALRPEASDPGPERLAAGRARLLSEARQERAAHSDNRNRLRPGRDLWKVLATAATVGAVALGGTLIGLPDDSPGSEETVSVGPNNQRVARPVAVTAQFYNAYLTATSRDDTRRAEKLRTRYLDKGLISFAKKWREKHDTDYLLRTPEPRSVKYSEGEEENTVLVRLSGKKPITLAVDVDPERQRITQVAERLRDRDVTTDFKTVRLEEGQEPLPSLSP